jgi:pyridoxine 4-dehydrogenase
MLRRPLGPFEVSAIGFGAMHLTGPRISGPPADRNEAIGVLREAIERGVDHIDTAQYYGPGFANEIIRDALHPYPEELVLVSKVGAGRDGEGGVTVFDEPAQLRLGIEDNLRTLDIDSLPIVNLRLMRGNQSDTFFDDQLAAMVDARDDGLIGAIGLSNVSLPQLLHALDQTAIACVQNAYHFADRAAEPLLAECRQRGIAFVPFWPLGGGRSGTSALADPRVAQVSQRTGWSPAQVALAWLLAKAPNILLIPGTSSREHLRENLSVTELRLDPEALLQLSQPEGEG